LVVLRPSIEDHSMIICIENLEAGIHWWLTNTPKWGADIMNSEYKDIYGQRIAGVTMEWWDAAVDRLWNWKAIRSPRRPNTKDEIKARGQERLNRISEQYDTICTISTSEPRICDSTWEQLQGLFDVCSEIKWGERKNASPVFACKMCHFLFPAIFPIVDNLATGVFDYEFYWRGMKDEWRRFAYKEEAKARLNVYVNSAGAAHESYPWETKIIELSHIGYSRK
jgi:hypothetical protein